MTQFPTTRYLRMAQLGLSLGAAAVLAAGCASSAAKPSKSSAAGAPAGASSTVALQLTNGHLTDGTGRTLYVWAADTGTTSTCSGACAKAWPPLTSSAAPTAGTGVTASDITLVKRSDGSTQVDYAGHPLYYFAGDTAAGDTNGQGADDSGAKWWEVDATGTAITTAAPASSPAGTTSAPAAPKSSKPAAPTSSAAGGGYGY